MKIGGVQIMDQVQEVVTALIPIANLIGGALLVNYILSKGLPILIYSIKNLF